MKIFGLTIGKDRAVPFLEFRDLVRLRVRRHVHGAQFENRDYGFVLNLEGKPPTTCNLRNLYADYQKSPKDVEFIIQKWIDSLVVDIPDHSWTEAIMTLRPTLKNVDYLAHAQRQMQKNDPPDSLPSSPFAGELSVIVMRELPGTVVAVTQSNLESWNVTFEEAIRKAIDNMNMLPFPPIVNSLNSATTIKGAAREEVGLVLEGDHLTASWLVVPRFRDYVAQRLQGDYVVYVGTRSRLTAVRSDESMVISQVQVTTRGLSGQMHSLTSQGFLVSSSTTGGAVSVYNPNSAQRSDALSQDSQFARRSDPLPAAPAANRRPGAVDFSSWGGLAESTDVAPDTGKKK